MNRQHSPGPSAAADPSLVPNVLLVDDQPARLLTYESILSGLGVSCMRAHSGPEALEQLLKGDFAVILLDVSMPEMDGFETARLIRQHPRHEHTPIIFVTGVHVSELDELRGYEMGAIDCVSVPIVPAILRGKVSILVQLYRQRRELEAVNRELLAARQQRSLHQYAIEREKLLEAERAARAEAESAMRAKDEFLATLSHELRTPLSNVVSWARVLEKKFSHQDPQIRRGLEIIVDNAMAQSQLISDLLDMSRIVAGKITLDTGLLELPPLIDRAVMALRPSAEAKGLQVHVEHGIEKGVVLGDSTRIHQVLWNLLSNAIKFTPAGGAPVRVRTRREERWLVVEVEDEGEGISAEMLPHVFDRFRQADGSVARRHGGLGLGLTIAKQLIEIHGGQVSARSDGPGSGARFTVRFPEMESFGAAPAVVSHDAEISRAEALRGLRIVVVEDQPAMLEYLQRTLEEHGAHVTAFGSPTAALEALRSQRAGQVDILLSDLGMPEIDGYQLIRQVREGLGFSAGALPAVALTALAREEDRTRALLSGYQAHLSKPYSAGQLMGLIQRLCAGRIHAGG